MTEIWPRLLKIGSKQFETSPDLEKWSKIS